eukprot:TRINITY_DN69530_c0_g1_i1.p1 TRINITY_DN69530_c0_g1~~TRINITY_DN69530_c0_g1_i1.p1  ORF type:complete len:244 (-),score=46.05 TRINITY_DN69530_c0_g1_i1:5-709(-)
MPFDVQNLTLDIRDPKQLFDVRVHTVEFFHDAVHQAEWFVHAPSFQKELVSHTQVHIVFSRRPFYYIVNFVAVLAGIGLVTLGLFAIPVGDVSDRLGHVMTLLLTTVAFKYAMSQQLPKLAYLTRVDKFLLAIFMLQLLCAVYIFTTSHQIFDEWEDDELANWDNRVLVAFVVGWFTCILWWFLAACYSGQAVGERLSLPTDPEQLKKYLSGGLWLQVHNPDETTWHPRMQGLL